MTFGELAIRSETRIDDIAQLYDIDFGPHTPGQTIGEWLNERLDGKPTLDASVPITGGRTIVRRLKSGRVATVGLQVDALLQVEPDEGLLARLEEDADELHGLRLWIGQLVRRA